MSTTKQKQNRKYCVVPQCANTNKNSPGKLFFCVPMESEIRKKWLTAMKRANSVGDKSKVFCCEDHFDIEEDTSNYIQYKIMCLHEKYKTTLRLKKGILPHKFHCQNDTAPQPKRQAYKKRRQLKIIKEALSAPPACTTPDLIEISQIDPLEANTSSSEIYTEDIETKYVCEVNCSDSLTTKNKMYVDKGVQVNRKIHFRSKGVNVNLCVKKKDKGVSTFPISRKSRSTSLKVAPKSDFKRGLLQDNPAVTASVSSAQPSVLSSSPFKSEISLPESSCLYKNECNII